MHIPPKGIHLIRRYGLYSSRSRGKWIDKPYIVRLAPDGWKEKLTCFSEAENIQAEHETDSCVSSSESRASWARLIAKVYEIDPMVCPKCTSSMKIIAVITDPEEVKKILKHFIKIGKPPPGLDPSSLN